jgi:hypothetical protein
MELTGLTRVTVAFIEEDFFQSVWATQLVTNTLSVVNLVTVASTEED